MTNKLMPEVPTKEMYIECPDCEGFGEVDDGYCPRCACYGCKRKTCEACLGTGQVKNINNDVLDVKED
jgi:hypothetical protein